MMIDHFLKSISYKIGWTFSRVDNELLISANAPERDLEQLVYLTSDFEIPEDLNKETAREWIQDCIYNIEMHEADEWLKIDGVRVREDHPDG